LEILSKRVSRGKIAPFGVLHRELGRPESELVKRIRKSGNRKCKKKPCTTTLQNRNRDCAVSAIHKEGKDCRGRVWERNAGDLPALGCGGSGANRQQKDDPG